MTFSDQLPVLVYLGISLAVLIVAVALLWRGRKRVAMRFAFREGLQHEPNFWNDEEIDAALKAARKGK